MPVKVTYAGKETTFPEGRRVKRGDYGELIVQNANSATCGLVAEGRWTTVEVLAIDAKLPCEETPALYLNIANYAGNLQSGDEHAQVSARGVALHLRDLLSASAPQDKVQDV